MATPIRLPITCALLGAGYTGEIAVGKNAAPANVLLDTGSGVLAVKQQAYDPDQDAGARTTQLAQMVKYVSGAWVGAVVETGVTIGGAGIDSANLAVTYVEDSAIFDRADGVLGLAYEVLDNAYRMPADTWQARYDADAVTGGEASDLDPYFDQLEQAGVVSNRFAFAVSRSIASAATGDPKTDPLNQGLFLLGGDLSDPALFAGPVTQIAVLHDKWYNAGLISVQVGDQPPIAATPGTTANPNAMIDSGTPSLMLDQTLYDAVIAAFGRINPDFAQALQEHALGKPVAVQSQLDLAGWPTLRLVLQGPDGAPAPPLTVAPQDYWQFDAMAKGVAVAVVEGDGGALGGQSILGLPLFAGKYVVFDRTAGAGLGVINFAAQNVG